MKRSAIFIFAYFMILFFVFCQKQKPFIQGTWEMVYQGFTSPDTAFVQDLSSFQQPQIKIFTDSHFAFGRLNAYGNIIAGGGIYTLIRDSTTEYVTYHSDSSSIRTFKFRVWMQNDTLYQHGTYLDWELLEKYIRLE